MYTNTFYKYRKNYSHRLACILLSHALLLCKCPQMSLHMDLCCRARKWNSVYSTSMYGYIANTIAYS